MGVCHILDDLAVIRRRLRHPAPLGVILSEAKDLTVPALPG